MTKVYVPLSKDMTDAEVVQAFKEVAAKMKAEKAPRRADQEAEIVEDSSHSEGSEG